MFGIQGDVVVNTGPLDVQKNVKIWHHIIKTLTACTHPLPMRVGCVG